MPTYTYRCRKCGRRFDLFHGIKDDSPKRCPKCRSRADRVPVGGAGILFKGSGFYSTDYRSSSYREKAKQEQAAGGAGASEKGKGAAKSTPPTTEKGKGAAKPIPPTTDKGAGPSSD